MIIDYKQLSPDTLHNVIEAFVLREGTDYGEVECTMAEKVAQVKAQLEAKEAFVQYSEEHESVSIIKAESL